MAASAVKIRPLHDRVLVQRVKEEEKTKGGIIIPDSAKEKPVEGKVIAVGNGKVLDERDAPAQGDAGQRACRVHSGEDGGRVVFRIAGDGWPPLLEHLDMPATGTVSQFKQIPRGGCVFRHIEGHGLDTSRKSRCLLRRQQVLAQVKIRFIHGDAILMRAC